MISEATQVMGIVNATPDSFYDGGRHASHEAAVAHAIALIDAGADWIDVGGESTRPGALAVSESQEIERVVPVIRAINTMRPRARISVDTRKSRVANAALEVGAQGINDISALSDPAMLDLAVGSNAVLFVMHMQGEPESMQREPRYHNVLHEVRTFLLERAERALAAGLSRGNIWIDPGIGFGKTVEHNLALIRGIPSLIETGFPVLIGASRKSFIGRLLDIPDPGKRLEGSLAVASIATWLGAGMLRVHDVAATRQVIAIATACRELPIESSVGSVPRAQPRPGYQEKRQ